MMIIPEIETIVLFVPRTGSGSLRRALAARYPKAMLLYRHMEADGAPAGYDRWRRVGVLRDPVDRLFSLWKFMGSFAGNHDAAYVAAMRAQGALPFERWLVENDAPFSSPYDSAGYGRYWPQYTARHPLAENRKSQFLYLRPDLGVEVWPYEALDMMAATLGLESLGAQRHNETVRERRPLLRKGTPAGDYVGRVFRWDRNAHDALSGEVRALNHLSAEIGRSRPKSLRKAPFAPKRVSALPGDDA